MPATRDPETRLRLFVTTVDQAVNRRAIRERTIKSHFKLTAGEAQSSLQVDIGDEEDVRSLLVAFRPFVSEKEPVFANWVFKELGRRLTDEEFRETARHNRGLWHAANAGQAVVVVNDQQFRGLQCFELIVNGEIFHSDETKQAIWNALPEFMQALFLQQLTGFVMDGLQVLYPTRNLVAEALDQGLLDLS